MTNKLDLKQILNKNTLLSVAVMVLLLGAATGIGYLFRYAGFSETNIVIVYILSTLITARFTPGYVFGIVTSLAATFTFNFFFTDPYFTLSVNDPGYIVTFIIMTITALTTSALTSKAKKSALEAEEIAQKQTKAREETERERYRANLLRAISHDLRTPLAGILGSSKMLEDVADDREQVIQIASDIYQEADWLHALVENILNLTRLQDGKLLPQKEPEAVEEIIGFAVSQISRRYPGIEIAVSAPDELLVVPMDARLISQVLINLLDNAAKHTKNNNGISISVTEEDGTVRFTVSDEGTGLREDDIPNIFDMFHTSEEKRTDAYHGIGLGLTICKAIVNAHGGEIIAGNRRDRQGAEFIFTLPGEDENEKRNYSGG